MNLAIVEHKDIRVLTTKQLAEQFDTETENISKNFNRNIERFEEGKHYFKLEGAELQVFKASGLKDDNLKFAPVLYLWTDRGVSRHAKILDTDEAWGIYEQLEDTYFKAKEKQLEVQQLSPHLQMFNQMFNAIASTELNQKRIEKIAIEAKTGLEQAKETLTQIKDTLAEMPKLQWREWINNSMNAITREKNINYDAARNESYELLEKRAGANLAERVRRAHKRMEDSGAKKTAIKNYRKLDAVEEDKRLKEIYSGIVKELRIKYLV